jgi:hypothetical protein
MVTKVTNLTACSWAEGRIDVFGVDPATGNIQQLYFENGGWNTNVIPNPFQGIQTRFQGYITACSWGAERIDIFGSDAAGELLHYYYGGFVLNRWVPESLGKQGLTGQMTSCSWGKNRIDIFGLNDTRDRMIQYYFDGSWEGPFSHDYENDHFRMSGLKPFVGDITSASWGPSRIDIFGQDSAGLVEQVYYDGGWASAFLEPTTSPTNAVISACAPDNGSVDIFWKDSDGNIQHYYYDGAWRPQKTIDNPFSGRNWTLQAASSWGKGRIDLFGMDDADAWLHVAHGWVPEQLP